MNDASTLERWTYAVSLVPARRGGVPLSEDLVAHLVSKRLEEGWQLVSDDSQGDGTRTLRFRRADGMAAESEV